jgi:ribulose-phosphate 3-epimerase
LISFSNLSIFIKEKWITDMAVSGASQFTFHLEATQTPEECIRKIKESGMNVGLAIKPNTPVDDLLPFVNDIDMALVMTVEPGKGYFLMILVAFQSS